ncbi:hypothetical protein [Gordonia sp. (in: high G+C Gram-positive bacteria)]|uniref:hypothetical protein n=1 Tax=Gordonia sp. (in: high G+C Gram-positive bacteria) TaxID=84139 RepID=UPI003342271C
MSTPGTPGSPDGQQSGVNHFAETMQRDIGSDRVSLDKGSTEQFANPGLPPDQDAYGYPASQLEPQYPGPQYPGPHNPGAQYPAGQYPSGQYPMTGYPQPYGRSGQSAARGVILGLAIACVIALVIGCVVVWKKVSDSSDSTVETTTAQVGIPQPGLTTTTTFVDPEAKAASDLASSSASDTAYMRSNSDNRWAAQVSAKWLGLYAEGRTWDNASIYSEYLSMKQRYPNVRLLRSADWPVFTEKHWWVIVSAQQFSTPSSALSWCVSQSLDKDHCFAKFISSTSGPDGSTLYQR